MTHEEMVLKAKEAKSVEELLLLAKENDIELTEESASAYFEKMHVTGQLADDELDNVSGGGCEAKDGRLVTTIANKCSHWACKHCGGDKEKVYKPMLNGRSWYYEHICPDFDGKFVCNSCKYMSYERGLWLCNHEANRK